MRIAQTSANLDRNPGLIYKIIPGVMTQRAAIHEFQNEKRGVPKFSNIKYGNDIGVLQAGDQPGFTGQLLHILPGEYHLVEQFERYISFQLQVEAPVNSTHATMSQEGIQAVAMVDDFTNHDLLQVFPHQINFGDYSHG